MKMRNWGFYMLGILYHRLQPPDDDTNGPRQANAGHLLGGVVTIGVFTVGRVAGC